MRRTMLIAAALAALTAASGALAHPHTAAPGQAGDGQVIANGQNHPALSNGFTTSCLSNGLLPGFGPAWYGIETAHHGPDAGTPGKSDGCYHGEADLRTGDDENPALG